MKKRVISLLMAVCLAAIGLTLSRSSWIGLALAVLCTLMGHSLFSWCLKFLSPAYVSAVKLCEPVVSGLLAVPLFGEIPTLLQLGGMALVLGSVLLYTRAESGPKA